MKITKERLRQIINEEIQKLSEGWGIDTGMALQKHGVTIGDVQKEAERLGKELYFINGSGKAFKALPDGKNLDGLPRDKVPNNIPDELIYTSNS